MTEIIISVQKWSVIYQTSYKRFIQFTHITVTNVPEMDCSYCMQIFQTKGKLVKLECKRTAVAVSLDFITQHITFNIDGFNLTP